MAGTSPIVLGGFKYSIALVVTGGYGTGGAPPTPSVFYPRLPPIPRISSKNWTTEQLNDIRAMWDDIYRATNRPT